MTLIYPEMKKGSGKLPTLPCDVRANPSLTPIVSVEGLESSGALGISILHVGLLK